MHPKSVFCVQGGIFCAQIQPHVSGFVLFCAQVPSYVSWFGPFVPRISLMHPGLSFLRSGSALCIRVCLFCAQVQPYASGFVFFALRLSLMHPGSFFCIVNQPRKSPGKGAGRQRKMISNRGRSFRSAPWPVWRWVFAGWLWIIWRDPRRNSEGSGPLARGLQRLWGRGFRRFYPGSGQRRRPTAWPEPPTR